MDPPCEHEEKCKWFRIFNYPVVDKIKHPIITPLLFDRLIDYVKDRELVKAYVLYGFIYLACCDRLYKKQNDSGSKIVFCLNPEVSVCATYINGDGMVFDLFPYSVAHLFHSPTSQVAQANDLLKIESKIATAKTIVQMFEKNKLNAVWTIQLLSENNNLAPLVWKYGNDFGYGKLVPIFSHESMTPSRFILMNEKGIWVDLPEQKALLLSLLFCYDGKKLHYDDVAYRAPAIPFAESSPDCERST